MDGCDSFFEREGNRRGLELFHGHQMEITNGKEWKGNISGLFLYLFSSNNEMGFLQICAGIVIALSSTMVYRALMLF